MISHRHKTIFVHIPKVAGQSIENVFLKDLGLNWSTRKPLLLMPNEQPENGPPRLAHLTSEEYVKYHYLSEEIFNNYFKFSFVRNPWDRVVSFYKFLYYAKGVTFEDFVKKLLPEFVNKNDFFFKSQYDYLYCKGKSCVDFIGRFENLNEDFSKILNTLGLSKLKLEHINKSKINKGKYSDIKTSFKKLVLNVEYQPFYPSYKSYYNQELISIVADLYKKDVEFFKYSF